MGGRHLLSPARLLRNAWHMLGAVGRAVAAEIRSLTMSQTTTAEQSQVNPDDLPKRDVSLDEFRAAAAAAQWKPDTVRLLLDFEPIPRKHMKVGEEMLRLVGV